MMPPASDRTRPSGFQNLTTQSCTAEEQLNLYMDRGSPAFNVRGRRRCADRNLVEGDRERGQKRS